MFDKVSWALWFKCEEETLANGIVGIGGFN